MDTRTGSLDRATDRPRRRAGASIRARVWLAVFLLPSPAAAARSHEVAVALDNAQGGCRVRGSFQAPVSRAVAWSVLTDYDHIGDFVSSVRSSRIERAADGRRLLRQDAVGKAFLLHPRIQVLLEIREDPGRRIAFHDVLGKDFRAYAGEWRIAADSSAMLVEYELAAEPRSAMGRALCRGMLRHTAQDLLEQVRAEILRRAAFSIPEGPASGTAP